MSSHNIESARYTFDELYSLDLTTLSGTSISLKLQAIDIEPERVEIYALIECDVWNQVVMEGAFHTDLEPKELGGDDDASVDIVLVLRQPIAIKFIDNEALLGALLSEEITVLHQTEAWLLASALQAVVAPGESDATLSTGFRTRWASGFP